MTIVEKQDKTIEIYKDALDAIKSTIGMTQLHDCCVNKTCETVYGDDGLVVAVCVFQYGVNRGYGENGYRAKEALEEVTNIKE